jgi:triacylglycerol lipase
MIQDTAAAALGLLVDYAMDMYTSPAGRQTMAPPADTRLAPTWVLRGYICGVDALLHTKNSMQLGQDHVCFGYLAEMSQTPGTFVAIVRGTDGFLEWIEDAEFVLVSHSNLGLVEQGFYDIYKTMQFRNAQGDMVSLPDGIASVVGGGTVTVVGHSLGSALATYLTLDLAAPTRLGARVSACLFASPQPGDKTFAALFDATVANYKLYNYELDAAARTTPHSRRRRGSARRRPRRTSASISPATTMSCAIAPCWTMA